MGQDRRDRIAEMQASEEAAAIAEAEIALKR